MLIKYQRVDGYNETNLFACLLLYNIATPFDLSAKRKLLVGLAEANLTKNCISLKGGEQIIYFGDRVAISLKLKQISQFV